MPKTDYEAMVAQGCAEAALATTIAGEFAAWDAVVAQHIHVEGRPYRVPEWIRIREQRRGKTQEPVGVTCARPDATGGDFPAASAEASCGAGLVMYDKPRSGTSTR